ncbi:MAG: hypothetical protein ACRDT6_17745 [Micromonosporaceae bacterium]
MSDQNVEPTATTDEPALTEETVRQWLYADPVRVDAVPEVFALHRDDDWFPDGPGPDDATGVVAWVFALPDGTTYVLSRDDDGRPQIVSGSDLVRVFGFWSSMFSAELVAVNTAE